MDANACIRSYIPSLLKLEQTTTAQKVRVDMRDFEALARKQKRAKAQQAAYAAQMAEQGRPYPRSLLLHDGTDDGSRTGTNSLGHDGVQVRMQYYCTSGYPVKQHSKKS